jgi:hypothetical protein
MGTLALRLADLSLKHRLNHRHPSGRAQRQEPLPGRTVGAVFIAVPFRVGVLWSDLPETYHAGGLRWGSPPEIS